jgi:hypothetical protein
MLWLAKTNLAHFIWKPIRCQVHMPTFWLIDNKRSLSRDLTVLAVLSVLVIIIDTNWNI